MRFVLQLFFLFFNFSILACNASDNLTYHFKLDKNKDIIVSVEFTGSAIGETKLIIPQSTSKKIAKYIRTPLLKNPKHFFLNKGDDIYVKHPPSDKVYIDYKITNNIINFDTMLAIKSSNFIVKNILIIPSKEECKIDYINISSEIFDRYNNPIDIKCSLNERVQSTRDILDAYLFVGQYQSVKLIQNNILHVPYGAQPKLDFINKLNKLIKIQNELFKNSTPSASEIWLINNENSLDIKGLKQGKNIIVDIGLIKDEKEIYAVLSHELMHRWFGSLIPQITNDKIFYEGFTEYYAQKSLLKAGIINQSEYISNYNKVLKNYQLSHANNVSFEDIKKHYFNNDFIMRIAYLRGQIIAQELDLKLREITFGKKTLEDIINSLLKASRNNSFIFSSKLLSDSFFSLTKQRDKFIDLAYNEGIINNPSSIIDGFKLKNVDVYKNNYGFDILKSFVNKTIVGLDSKSVPFNKGLRNKQKLLGFNIDSNIIEVNVGIKNKKKLISYSPQKIPQKIIQYSN